MLCVDIGSSSLKAGLIGEDGFVLNTQRIHYSETRFFCSDFSQVWLESFVTAARNLLESTGATPSAICISGNGPSLVAVSKTTGNTATFMWDEPPFVSVQGTHSIFIPRLVALSKKHPEIFCESRVILNCPEFLIYSLTGVPLTIIPEKRFLAAYWSKDELKENGLEDIPLANDFVPSGHKAGFLLPQFLTALGLDSKALIPVICGGPDFVTALIGTGTIMENTVLDRAGSSEGINLCSASATSNETYTAAEKRSPNAVQKNFSNDAAKSSVPLRILPSVIEGLWNKSVILSDTGSRFSQWKKTSIWKEKSYEECVRELLALKKTDAVQYKKNSFVMESILSQVKKAYSTLLSEIPEGVGFTVKCCGGQAKNPEWMQLKADTVGLPLNVTNCPDSELAGCAIIAFTSLSVFDGYQSAVEKIVHIEKTFLPNA